MKLPLTITLIAVLALLLIYFLFNGSLPGVKKYDWNLELTKPQNYKVKIQNVTYYVGNKEIYRQTSMPPYTEWVGAAGGRVLHVDSKATLPDSMKITWKEVKTGAAYTGKFKFPGEEAVAYWNDNYQLQQQKWGADYPKGPLSFKLGIAPGGLLTLWFSDLDVNTSGFALELVSHRAKTTIAGDKSAEAFVFDPVFDLRFGTPQFHAFEGKNVVAIKVTYHNGELEVVSTKSANDSILKRLNDVRGWGLAKNIRVTWFDAAGQGYRSFYDASSKSLPASDTWSKLNNTSFIYLLDRPDAPGAAWNKLTEKYVLQLTEVKREAF